MDPKLKLLLIIVNIIIMVYYVFNNDINRMYDKSRVVLNFIYHKYIGNFFIERG